MYKKTQKRGGCGGETCGLFKGGRTRKQRKTHNGCKKCGFNRLKGGSCGCNFVKYGGNHKWRKSNKSPFFNSSNLLGRKKSRGGAVFDYFVNPYSEINNLIGKNTMDGSFHKQPIAELNHDHNRILV
jgi:hypothetical protein